MGAQNFEERDEDEGEEEDPMDLEDMEMGGINMDGY
jgi:hypothetical protein